MRWRLCWIDVVCWWVGAEGGKEEVENGQGWWNGRKGVG